MFLLLDLWELSVSFFSSVLRANVSAFKVQRGHYLIAKKTARTRTLVEENPQCRAAQSHRAGSRSCRARVNYIWSVAGFVPSFTSTIEILGKGNNYPGNDGRTVPSSCLCEDEKGYLQPWHVPANQQRNLYPKLHCRLSPSWNPF